MSAPTARGMLNELYASTDPPDQARVLAARVEAVIALHRHTPEMQWGNVCCHCFKEWPCPTVRLLDGEKP